MDAIFGSPKDKADAIWQDREIRFDVPGAELDCRRGEAIVETLVRDIHARAHAVYTAMYS